METETMSGGLAATVAKKMIKNVVNDKIKDAQASALKVGKDWLNKTKEKGKQKAADVQNDMQNQALQKINETKEKVKGKALDLLKNPYPVVNQDANASIIGTQPQSFPPGQYPNQPFPPVQYPNQPPQFVPFASPPNQLMQQGPPPVLPQNDQPPASPQKGQPPALPQNDQPPALPQNDQPPESPQKGQPPATSQKEKGQPPATSQKEKDQPPATSQKEKDQTPASPEKAQTDEPQAVTQGAAPEKFQPNIPFDQARKEFKEAENLLEEFTEGLDELAKPMSKLQVDKKDYSGIKAIEAYKQKTMQKHLNMEKELGRIKFDNAKKLFDKIPRKDPNYKEATAFSKQAGDLKKKLDTQLKRFRDIKDFIAKIKGDKLEKFFTIDENTTPETITKMFNDYMDRIEKDLTEVDGRIKSLNDPNSIAELAKIQLLDNKGRPTLNIHRDRMDEMAEAIEKKPKELQDLKLRYDEVRSKLEKTRTIFKAVNLEKFADKIDDELSRIELPPEFQPISTPQSKAITAAIIAVYQLIRSIYRQFSKSPVSVSLLTVGSFGMIIFTGILAVLYGVTIISNFIDNKLINNPTNSQSLDFMLSNFGNSMASNPLMANIFGSLFANLTSGKYKFGLFLILPWITLTLAIVGIYFSIKKEQEGQPTGGAVKGILYACVVHALIALFINYMVFFYAYKMIKMTSFRINAFNNHVLANMIQKADFLGELQKVPTNSFATLDIVKNSISKLFSDNLVTQGIKRYPSQTDLGKAMFTLNMYMHFQELGFRNPALYDAISSFRMYSFILSKQNFQPANYLRRKSTFVRDNSEIFRQVVENILKQVPSVPQGKGVPPLERTKYINRAIIMASRATAEANNLANIFYPEDAMIRVLRMAVTFIIIQWLPVLIAMWVFRNPDVRAGFRDAVNLIMKK